MVRSPHASLLHLMLVCITVYTNVFLAAWVIRAPMEDNHVEVLSTDWTVVHLSSMTHMSSIQNRCLQPWCCEQQCLMLVVVVAMWVIPGLMGRLFSLLTANYDCSLWQIWHPQQPPWTMSQKINLYELSDGTQNTREGHSKTVRSGEGRNMNMKQVL